MREINHIELAWAAGFFDGEGCIYIHKHSRGRNCLAISINQQGVTCLRRFNEAILGLGHINGPHIKGSSGITYCLGNGGFEGAQAIIALLWKYLSKPKREQAKRVITELRAMRRPLEALESA